MVAWLNGLVTQPSAHLKNILSEIHRRHQSGQKSLVVFDLDSTLFDVSPRIQKILQDFSQDKTHRAQFPESCQILESIEMWKQDWGFKDALARAGLGDHHPDFHLAVKNFWSKTFFTNEYLEYDMPYDGACEYVQAVQAAGADISYLTGRDIPRMGPGSLSVLKKWKFPVGEEQAQLVLKPQKEMDDAQFKVDYFSPALKKQFSKIWFFENEPVNIDLVRKVHPDIEVVFFDSTHSGLSQAPLDLPTIMHYLLEE